MAGRVVGGNEAEGLIEECWGVALDHRLPAALKLAKLRHDKEFWDLPVIAALSVLASLTPGQSRLAAGFLKESVQLRVSDGDDTSTVIQVHDVVNAVTRASGRCCGEVDEGEEWEGEKKGEEEGGEEEEEEREGWNRRG
jgi:hypothetical protein